MHLAGLLDSLAVATDRTAITNSVVEPVPNPNFVCYNSFTEHGQMLGVADACNLENKHAGLS
jgi:hypothetical protein